MTVPDVRPALDALAKHPLLRGIRQQFHWHENPQYRFAPTPDLCRDPTVQRNVARLADYGLAFDLQVFAAQMAGAAELADACPAVTFVLQHAGMLEDLTDDGRAAWKSALRDLAAPPERHRQALRLRHLHPPQRPAPISSASCTTPSRSSAPAAASSARTSRSRSCGRPTPTSSPPSAAPRPISRAGAQADIFERTATRVYRL